MIGIIFLFQWASAEATVYQLESKESSIHFFLPYTTGTHEGDAKGPIGKVKWDEANLSEVNGEVSVPLSSIVTGDETRDCHLREALGLNYAVSDFPKDHICKDGALPTSGKNSVVYPSVIFKVLHAKKLDEENSIEIEGEWTLHGITRSDRIKMNLIHEGKKLRLKGETLFSLQNYGVQVKPAKVLFVTISVHDQVRVVLDLLLSP
jgi:polyisoprenoid-binding protein YceI